MGVTIGCDAAKSGKNTHLLVVIRMRIFQKIGLLDLTNHNRFKKVNGYKIRKKIVRDHCGMHLMLHTPSYYYGQKISTSWGFVQVDHPPPPPTRPDSEFRIGYLGEGTVGESGVGDDSFTFGSGGGGGGYVGEITELVKMETMRMVTRQTCYPMRDVACPMEIQDNVGSRSGTMEHIYLYIFYFPCEAVVLLLSLKFQA